MHFADIYMLPKQKKINQVHLGSFDITLKNPIDTIIQSFKLDHKLIIMCNYLISIDAE